MHHHLARSIGSAMVALMLAACGTPNELAQHVARGDAGASSGEPKATPAARRDAGAYAAGDAGAMAGAEPAQQRPASGRLTAGSIDDHLNPEVFDAFLAHAQQYAAQAPSLAQRAQIRVRSTTGAPLGNALVRVRDSAGKQLLEARTGTDGRTLFLPALDGAQATGPFKVEATAGSVSGTALFELADAPWELRLAAPALAPSQLDLAFVIDTTGSMADELAFLQAETAAIAAKVAAAYPHVDMRFALIAYRDEGDIYVTRRFDFGELSSFSWNLGRQDAGGGGDYEEAVHVALAEAGQALAWRSGNVARVAFLIADAPPHPQFVGATFKAVDVLRKAGVRLYPVASSGVAELAEYVMRAAAFVTLARYIFLTDDSGVGGEHAEPHMPADKTVQPCYVIEKLEQLMIRMISSELAGKLLFPAPETVLRTVGNPVDGVCQQQPDAQAATSGDEQ